MDEYGERIYSDDEMLEFRGHKFLMDEDGNRNYTDSSAFEYENSDTVKSVNVSSMSSYVDRIEYEINEFIKQNEIVNKHINEISNKLLNNTELLNFNNDVDKLTNDVRELDDSVKVINADLRIFEQIYGNITTFSMKSTDLVDLIISTKDNLKALKMEQVSNYNAMVDVINNKLSELKNLDISNLSENIVDEIDSLEELEKNEYEVTDWKYKKHTNINYDEIEFLYNSISRIENMLNLVKASPYVEKLDGIRKVINDKIEDIERSINSLMTLEDFNKVKKELRDLENNVYNFGTDLSLNKDNITEEQYELYFNSLKDIRASLNYLNDKLIDSKAYSGINNELVDKLKILKVRIDSFLRYVNVHYGNANESIIKFDKEEFATIKNHVEQIKRDILVRENQLVKSQFDRLMDEVNQMESELTNISSMLNNKDMLKKNDNLDIILDDISEIEEGLQEVENKINGLSDSKNNEDKRLISKALTYLKIKITVVEVILSNCKDDVRYNELFNKVNNYKEKLSKIVEIRNKKMNELKLKHNVSNKNALRVKKIKSGKSLLKKHGKLLLVSAGLIALTLLMRKFLLIPAIMHANVMLGVSIPSWGATTAFFNKILGGIIGASLNANGVWCMSNGVLLSSSVATTSLLKGLIVGFGGTAISLVPILIISIKELVEKMKIKEHNHKISNVNKDVKIIRSGYVGKYEQPNNLMKEKLSKIKGEIYSGLSALNTYNRDMNLEVCRGGR